VIFLNYIMSTNHAVGFTKGYCRPHVASSLYVAQACSGANKIILYMQYILDEDKLEIHCT